MIALAARPILYRFIRYLTSCEMSTHVTNHDFQDRIRYSNVGSARQYCHVANV